MKYIHFLLLLVIVGGCKEADGEVFYSQAAPLEIVAPDADYDVAKDKVSPTALTGNTIPVENRIIKTAQLRFETPDMAKTAANIQSAVSKYNATVQQDFEGNVNNAVSKRMTIRVPSKNFNLFLDEISKGVSYFDEKEISARDVTEEYIDVEARIKTKKQLEVRYLELLKKATKVSEMLEIEQQLSQIREEIEAKEGRLKYLQSQVSMSTVTVEFYKTKANQQGATVSYGSKIVNAIKSGFNGISSFFIWLIEVWPFMLILVALIYLIRKTIEEKITYPTMLTHFKKKYIIPVVAAGFLFVGTSFRDDFFEIAKQIEIFTELFKTVNMNYVDQTNPGEMMDKAIKSMLTDLDPYTNYFNEQDVLKFKINATGEYTGIGAIITRKGGKVIIKEPYKNYPADKAGLKAGDEIIQIGDVNLIDFKEDASQLLKGSKNAKIDIKYIRQGKTNTTQIVLEEIDVKAVPFFGKADDKTGYIVLSQFNQKASLETKEALEKLKKDGAERIILDLRGNPGGLLNEAVNICNLFVAKGEVIVTTKSKIEKHNNTYKTTRDPIDLNIPLIVLVDGKSASASEIVAGALQDLDRAVVIGSRSFGKGLVQRPIDLTYGTQVKVTISRYYTPSGRCIQALNYGEKDANGSATRTDAKNYNAFKTKGGRTVYDGGGILPDIEMEETKLSAISESLQKNDGIFNYVTDYYYKNPTFGDKIPTISDADYQGFKSFLKKENFSFKTETEVALKKTLETAKREKLDEAITAEYQQLLTALQRSEESQLNKFQKEIKNLIVDEIILRYQYKEGLYNYYLKSNAEIKKSLAILNNPTEYNKILSR